LPGKLYKLFPTDEFYVEKMIKFLYEILLQVKMDPDELEEDPN